MSLSPEMDTPSVDEMIEDGAPIDQIAARFPTLTDAINYYAAYQSQAFGPQTVGEVCCVCRADADLAAAYDWEGQLPYVGGQKLLLLLTLIGAWTGHPFHLARPRYARFRTLHPMCFRCWQKAQARAGVSSKTDIPAAIVFVVGLIATLGGIIWPWNAKMKEAEALPYHTAAVIGLFLAIGAMLWGRLAAKRTALGPLSGIARRPFRCKAVSPAGALRRPA
jgi:hypothetical protein